MHMLVKRQGGFTLLEVLIAIMILSVGLLGLAGLQARAHLAEIDSYSRASALMLASDLADRINANMAQAIPNTTCSNVGCYHQPTIVYGKRTACSNHSAPNPTYVNVDSACKIVATSPCSSLTTTWDRDLCEWDRALLGASETSSTGSQIGTLKNAVGCVSNLASDTAAYLVEVAWEGPALAGSVAATTCGSTIAERNRRVVSRVVRFAELAK